MIKKTPYKNLNRRPPLFINSHRRRQIFCVLLLTGILLGISFIQAGTQTSGNLQVSFIDVGQGDSALLQDPNGFNVLIDGGLRSEGPKVVDFLRSKGIDHVDVMVASHADADHIGGLIDVLEMTDIPVLAVVINGYAGTSQTWEDFLFNVTLEKLTPTIAQFPSVQNWGSMEAYVLNPPSDLVSPETNAASLVLRIDYGDISLLFSGDIDAMVEEQVVARGTSLAAEVLKVAHHGSQYGSSSIFLAAVGPSESIISVGENNIYRHPAAETILRLQEAGANIYRTDLNGSVLVISDGSEYSLSVERTPTGIRVFLPFVARDFSVASSTPIPSPVPGTDNVLIEAISALGVGSAEPDEYVSIRNMGNFAVQLSGWTLRDLANHLYTFPSYSIQPGQECRVYTNQSHPEWCGFNYESGSAIWNNGGDCAELRNGTGDPVNKKCFP